MTSPLMVEKIHMYFPGEGTLHQFIVRRDDVVVGLITVDCERGSSAHFSRLHVAPAHRRQRIGTILVNCAIDLARSYGRESITCTVHPSNKEAQDFYRRLGFVMTYQFADGDMLFGRAIAKEAA